MKSFYFIGLFLLVGTFFFESTYASDLYSHQLKREEKDTQSVRIFYQFSSKKEEAPLLVFVHGLLPVPRRGALFYKDQRLFQRLSNLGFHVASYDRPGYGQTKGERLWFHPDEVSILADVIEAFFQKLNLKSSKIFLFVEDIGSIPVLGFLTTEKAKKYNITTIFARGFFNIGEQLKELKEGDLYLQDFRRSEKLSSSEKFNLHNLIPELHGKFILFHGKEDKTMKYSFTKAFYKDLLKHQKSVRMWTLEQGFYPSSKEKIKRLKQFLK